MDCEKDIDNLQEAFEDATLSYKCFWSREECINMLNRLKEGIVECDYQIGKHVDDYESLQEEYDDLELENKDYEKLHEKCEDLEYEVQTKKEEILDLEEQVEFYKRQSNEPIRG
jgi:predicted RNase H-like nuclease (RuvC/YqgF family)